jgi:hypothetical protein
MDPASFVHVSGGLIMNFKQVAAYMCFMYAMYVTVIMIVPLCESNSSLCKLRSVYVLQALGSQC